MKGLGNLYRHITSILASEDASLENPPMVILDNVSQPLIIYHPRHFYLLSNCDYVFKKRSLTILCNCDYVLSLTICAGTTFESEYPQHNNNGYLHCQVATVIIVEYHQYAAG